MYKNPLRIAQIASLIERVPPKKYGGTERVVHLLTEELIKRGHKVSLFASGDSITSAKLISVYPKSLREAKVANYLGLNDLTLLNIGTAYKLEDQFDIIHDHNGGHSLPTANKAKTPVMMTLHGAFTPTNKHLYKALNNPKFVAISHAQAKAAPPGANIYDVVYNGLAMENYPFSQKHQGYLLFVGRISMEKGTHIAIEVAQQLNLPLIIAAKLDQVDILYFNKYIKPLLSDSRIKWIGEVNEEKRNKLMSQALCMLHPVTWMEPFGLTLIEAMACGCPVIAINKGSIPEIIVDNKTGFVVKNTKEMVEAVLKIDKIDRSFCRSHVLVNFNDTKMTDRYEELYYKIIHDQK